jgi:hypothetical protein
MSLNPTDSRTVLDVENTGTAVFSSWILYLVNNIIYVDQTIRIWSGSVQGGNGGGPFDDFHSDRRVVTEVRVWAGKFIDTIQVVYSGSAAPKHSGNGGQSYTFSLENKEKIVRIDGRGAKYIDQLQFFTDTGDFF